MNNFSEIEKKAIGAIGLTGVGKSTIVDIAVRELGYVGFYEQPANNPLIAQMYENPKKYALPAQMWFLEDKHRILNEAVEKIKQLENGKRAAFDMPPWGDGIHAYRHYAVGNISKADYHEIYEPAFEAKIAIIANQIFSTVYHIYAEIDTILNRIETRGREYERNITAADLVSLNNATLYWLDKIARQGVKVVSYDTEHINLKNKEQDQKDLAKFIKKTESG